MSPETEQLLARVDGMVDGYPQQRNGAVTRMIEDLATALRAAEARADRLEDWLGRALDLANEGGFDSHGPGNGVTDAATDQCWYCGEGWPCRAHVLHHEMTGRLPSRADRLAAAGDQLAEALERELDVTHQMTATRDALSDWRTLRAEP